MNDNFSKPAASHPVMSEEEIMGKLGSISPEGVAAEVGQWMLDNVDNYIDNHRKIYRLYLTVGASDSMPNSELLQRLYMSIPTAEDEGDTAGRDRESRCLDALDDITSAAKKVIEGDKNTLQKLYDKLIYYYEMTGFSSQSGPIVQQFDGYVELREFVYEPLSMEIVVSAGEEYVDASGNPVGDAKPKEVMKREMMPEGFAVEFELKYWKKPQQSLY